MRNIFRAIGTFLLILVVLSTSHLLAQEAAQEPPKPAEAAAAAEEVDVTQTDLTEEKLNNPPKREITFELLEETRKLRPRTLSPKLIAQKHIAAMSFAWPYRQIDTTQVEDLYPIQVLDSRPFPPQPQYAQISLDGTFKASVSWLIPKMSKLIPPDRLPDAKVIESLSTTAKDPRDAIVWFGRTEQLSNDDRPEIRIHFAVLAETLDQAKLRATVLLTLLDHGACRPYQLHQYKLRESQIAELRKQRVRLLEGKATAGMISDSMHGIAAKDLIPTLTAQQLEMQVDFAGVKARIDACDKLLGKGSLSSSRREQVENAKINAEIELTSVQARQAKSSELVAMILAHQNAIFARQIIPEFERKIRSLDAGIRAFGPLKLIDDKVTIQPIEWAQ